MYIFSLVLNEIHVSQKSFSEKQASYQFDEVISQINMCRKKKRRLLKGWLLITPHLICISSVELYVYVEKNDMSIVLPTGKRNISINF